MFCNYLCLLPKLCLFPGLTFVIISDVIIVIWAMRLSACGPFVSSALRSRFCCFIYHILCMHNYSIFESHSLSQEYVACSKQLDLVTIHKNVT